MFSCSQLVVYHLISFLEGDLNDFMFGTPYEDFAVHSQGDDIPSTVVFLKTSKFQVKHPQSMLSQKKVSAFVLRWDVLTYPGIAMVGTLLGTI